MTLTTDTPGVYLGPLPPSVVYGRCILNIYYLSFDTPDDEDEYPEMRTPAQASLKLTPNVTGTVIMQDGSLGVVQGRTLNSKDGSFDFWCVDGTNSDLNPQGWNWKAQLTIDGRLVQSFNFNSDSTRDNTSDPLVLGPYAITSTTQTGQVIIRGPEGPAPQITWDGTVVVVDGVSGPDLQGPKGDPGSDADATAATEAAQAAQSAAQSSAQDAAASAALVGAPAGDAIDAHYGFGDGTAPNFVAATNTTMPGVLTGKNNVILTVPTPTSPNTINGNNQLRALIGGYDSILGDGLALTMLQPMHSSISDDSTHVITAGGSYLKAYTANYSGLFAGTANTIGVSGSGVAANYSVILGGQTNTITGYWCGILGGTQNLAAAQGAVVLGGKLNTNYGDWALVSGYQNTLGSETNATWGQYAGIVGGYQVTMGTTASARFSASVGGHSNDIQVEYAAVIGGKQAKPRFNGAQAWAAGAVAAAGDAQMERAVFRGVSTDAFAKQLLVDGATRLVMPANTTWAFEGVVTGRRGTDGETGAWKIAGVIARGATAASTTILGTPTVTPMGSTTGQASAWVVDAIADTTFGALSVRGRSPSGGTVSWVGGIDLTEVTA